MNVRFKTPEEREAVERAAAAEGVPVSTWIRRQSLRAAGRSDLADTEPADDAARAASELAKRRRSKRRK